MKILLIHNTYQIAGGEDSVFENEIELLRQNGHEVDEYLEDNISINSFLSKLWTFINLVFSYRQYSRIKRCIMLNRPDIIHVHNYFPLITPSVFCAAKKMEIPIVHTLHNYRAVCPTALLMHKGEIQEKSIKHSSWWAVREKVYRNSYIGSLAVVLMVEIHKKVGTWKSKVDRFIALTDFSKAKFVEAGWPKDKISVKPNFIVDPFPGVNNVGGSGGYALFVGRLSPEKGVDVLLEAWKHINFPLKVIGEEKWGQAPISSKVKVDSRVADGSSGSDPVFLGVKERLEVLELVKNADFLVMPSIWYETFGMVIIEAFACGTPVVCSRLGSLVNIVDEGVTGLHFKAGNSEDLSEKIQRMIDNPEKMREMGMNARQVYLDNYTPEKNYAMLMDIYQQAMDEAEKS